MNDVFAKSKEMKKEKRLKIELGELSIKELMQDLHLEYSKQAESKEIMLTNTFEGKIPGLLIGDKNKLYSIFSNIIGNAIKYTNEKGRIEISTSYSPVIDDNGGEIVFENDKSSLEDEPPKQCELVVIVEDNGIGIREEDKERIFQLFEQLETKEREKGTGIGLSLIKELIEGMKGTITIESQYTKGTKVIVRLPLKVGNFELVPDNIIKVLDDIKAEAFTKRQGKLMQDTFIEGILLSRQFI